MEPVDLTVLIDGCEVELNSFDIDPSMVPFTGWYFAGVPISMEAEEECEGAEFLYWEVVSGDVVIDDIQNPITEIELTGDAAIVAHFGEPVPPEVVVFAVEPAGVGDIQVNGVVAGPYPDALELFDGEHDISASADMWWVFSHWSHENNTILPELESQDATFWWIRAARSRPTSNTWSTST